MDRKPKKSPNKLTVPKDILVSKYHNIYHNKEIRNSKAVLYKSKKEVHFNKKINRNFYFLL